MGGNATAGLNAGAGGFGMENSLLCLDIRGNTFDVSAAGFPISPVVIDQESGLAIFDLPNYAGSPQGEFPVTGAPGTASTDAVPYLVGRGNTLIDGPGELFSGVNASTVAGMSGNFTTCP